MGNNALNANPNTFRGGADDILHVAYSDWYFTVCAIMTVASITFIALAARKPRRDRLFHYITAAITIVAAIAYFTMGSNLGWVPINAEFVRGSPAGISRQIFYVRYIDWFITTPLLLMDLLLTAGMPWPTILFVILMDEIMIVTGLIGALVHSSYKWGYFTFAMVALFYILYHLTYESLRHSARFGADVRSVFLRCGALTAVVWTLYPIAWGVCEGGNVINTDNEAIFYGILDLLAKPLFGALLIHGHRKIDPARLGLHIRDYDESDPRVGKHHEARDAAVIGTQPGDHPTHDTTTTGSGLHTHGAGTTSTGLHGTHGAGATGTGLAANDEPKV